MNPPRKSAVLRFGLHALLLLLAACIAGWAFLEMIRPGNVFDVVRLLSAC